MNITIPKQAVSQLKKLLDNFKLNEAIEISTNEAQATISLTDR